MAREQRHCEHCGGERPHEVWYRGGKAERKCWGCGRLRVEALPRSERPRRRKAASAQAVQDAERAVRKNRQRRRRKRDRAKTFAFTRPTIEPAEERQQIGRAMGEAAALDRAFRQALRGEV